MSAKRGRPSKEEEVRRYLAQYDLNLDELLGRPAENIEVPDDPQEIIDELTKIIYKRVRGGGMKDTALVNSLKVLDTLAERARGNEDDDGPERGIDEILRDAGLPVERKVEIADLELSRLQRRLEALRSVRDGLTEPAAL